MMAQRYKISVNYNNYFFILRKKIILKILIIKKMSFCNRMKCQTHKEDNIYPKTGY